MADNQRDRIIVALIQQDGQTRRSAEWKPAPPNHVTLPDQAIVQIQLAECPDRSDW